MIAKTSKTVEQELEKKPETTDAAVLSEPTPQFESVKVVQEPVQSSKQAQPTNFLIVLLAIALLVVGVGFGGAVLAAQQLGQDTTFARFARVVPVEQMPIVKNFVKSLAELLSRAFRVESDLEFQKKLNSREYNATTAVSVTGKANNTEFTANGKVKQNLSMNLKSNQYRYVTSFGGQVEAGAIGINPGEEAVKVEVLQPGLSEMYFKFNLSSPMLKTIKSGMNSRSKYPTSVESDEFKIEDYLDKYMKLDLDEYMKLMNEQVPAGSTVKVRQIDPEKMYEAYYKLYDQLNPDIMALYDKTVGQWGSFATVKYQDRVKVDQLTAVWITADIDPEKFADVSWEFVSGMPALLKDHREDLLNYCKEASSIEDNNASCEKTFSEKAFQQFEKQLSNNPDGRKKLEEAFKNMVRNIKFQKVRVAVNPVDNSMLKFEVELSMDKEAFQRVLRALDVRESMIETFPLETFTLNISSEEVKRGHNFTVQAPSDSMNLVEKLRDYIEAEKRRRRKQEEELQKMMEQYRQDSIRRPNPVPTYTPYVY